MTATAHTATATPDAVTVTAAAMREVEPTAPSAPARAHPAPPRPIVRETCRLALRIGAAILAAITVAATVTRLMAAAPARRWLDYPFTGVPARPGEAAVIAAHNARALSGVLGLLLIAQIAPREPAGPRPAQRALQRAGEALLSGQLAANVLIVAAGLGAYGSRMARALLPHGPLELAAFALALALYLQGRRRPLPSRYLLTTGALSALLLAGAAALETFVSV
jgi:hypothetical protein